MKLSFFFIFLLLIINVFNANAASMYYHYYSTIFGNHDPPGKGSSSPAPANGTSNHSIIFPVRLGDKITITAISTPSNGGICLSPEVGSIIRFDPEGVISGITLAWPGIKQGKLYALDKEDSSYHQVSKGPYQLSTSYSGTKSTMTLEFYVNDTIDTYNDNNIVTGSYNITVEIKPKNLDLLIPTSVVLAPGYSRYPFIPAPATFPPTIPPPPPIACSFLPSYAPPLIEGTAANPMTYCFKSEDNGTPSPLSIDNGSNIGWAWYIVDYSASTPTASIPFTYEQVYNGTAWSGKIPTLTYPYSSLIGTLISNVLTLDSLNADIKTGAYTSAIANRPTSFTFPANALNPITTHMIHFDFPIGGEYIVGLVCYYVKNGILKKRLLDPLEFEIQAINTDVDEAIYFHVNDPTPAGGYLEDKEYQFSCTTWIDYGSIVNPPLAASESDNSEASNGVLTDSVKYHWFVNHWDDASSTLTKIHPSSTPLWTLLLDNNTVVNNFKYVFPTPLKAPDKYIIGISFEWEEVGWKPIYSNSGANTQGFDSNAVNIANNPYNIIRYELDSAYTGVIRQCQEELGIDSSAAKIHNIPVNPPQLIRDGTCPVMILTVEDMTPPEIMFLDQNFATPIIPPVYNGTTGDDIKIGIKIRDNHPQELMNNRPPILIWEFQPEGYAAFVGVGVPCFQSKGTMTLEINLMSASPTPTTQWNASFLPPTWPFPSTTSFSKFESIWYTYEATITLPFAFRSATSGNPIYRFSVHVQDAAGFTNEGINYTYLDDDRADHNYYPGSTLAMLNISGLEDSSCNFGQFHDASKGMVSVDDNDQPALAVRIEPKGFFSALAYRHNIYHVSTNDIWDPLDITDSTLIYDTTNTLVTEMVHPYDPAYMASYVTHPKVNSFPEDLNFDIYVEFYDNCIWEGDAPTDPGVNYSGSDNIKPNSDIGGYFMVSDATDTSGMSDIPQTIPPANASDVIVNPTYNTGLYSGGAGEAVTILNNIYFQWLFYDANDRNDDGYPDQDITPPPPGTPPLDPSAPEFYFDVGCEDKAGNKRRLKLRFPIRPIPVFLHSLEEKSRIFKRK